jgi:molecular chaperone DnaK (HSP70)
MGRGRDDVRDEERYFPFRISCDDQGVVRVGLGEREYAPPEIAAFILRELKRRAETHVDAGQPAGNGSPLGAVITVPAYFNDAQRTATRDAGRLAGLEVLRIINEPTAAALAYGLDKRRAGVVAVYDLGGGTFDISILRIEEGVFQVLSTNGDTHLGGDDIDLIFTERVMQALGGESAAAHANGASSAELAQVVRKAVIRAKHELSDRDETAIVVGDFRFPLARAAFEEAIRPVVNRTLEPCRQALADAGIAPAQVDEVVLVGGSTRIPLVRRQVEALFGRKPHVELNPDEVVALGAAVQADILATGNRELLLLDVTPLSLGIETMGGVVSRIIARNSTIPASGSETFTTAVDRQTAVDIHVLQGERELVADNRSLARFTLRGIPPMPAGLPRVRVRFQIDANGILGVTASELRTGIEQTVEVKPSYGLTDEEVERMLIEALDHAEADREARLLVDARNEARSVIAATRKHLQSPDLAAIEQAELAPDERKKIEAVMAGLEMVLNSSDSETIRKWTHALNDATAHLAEVVMNRAVRAALAGKAVDSI